MLRAYSDLRVEGVGGSGIVLSGLHAQFQARHAIKVPRLRLYSATTEEERPPDIDPEIHALSKLSHKNITRLFNAVRLHRGNGICCITEYVSDPRPLDSYARDLCCSAPARADDDTLAASILTLARTVLDLAQALQYMHAASLFHFDVKPDNLLISSTGHPFVTDLGFARDSTRYRPDEVVHVGFTWKYAHPGLTDPHAGARISQTPAKAKNRIPGSGISPVYDVFAFGRTVQELLRVLQDEYGEHIFAVYGFNFLHLVACLCLDGRNAENHRLTPGRTFASDQAMALPLRVFEHHRFRSFGGVCASLERLLGLRRIETEVPELDRWSQLTINVSDTGITTFTRRVAALVQHPALERLAAQFQLGMIDTVFPTATHTRFQHTLGVYHAAVDYLTALYYDAENPVFRVLCTPEDLRTAVVAALVHDIGQSTFGHEMEEIDADTFSHVALFDALHGDTSAVDDKGRTLKQLIEGTGADCCQVSAARVRSILNGQTESPIDSVLRDILDSQIDADKLDYLIRDSVECRVPYGHGIDVARFIRSLTTAGFEPRPGAGSLRLAIKRKGIASAEAFAFARYQLFQSVYWHHTFRAAKAMFLTAAADAISELRGEAAEALFDQSALRTAYLREVIGFSVTEPEAPRGRRRTLADVLRRRLAEDGPPSGDGKYAQDPTIAFLWRIASGRSRALLTDLIRRRYYKRVYELPLENIPGEQGWIALRDRLRGQNRHQVQRALEEAMTRVMRTAIQDQSTTRESLRTDEVLERFEGIAGGKYCFLIDLPLRGWMAGGDSPMIVSDYKRRHFGASRAMDHQTGGLWKEEMGRMMRRAAVLRVVCEPEVHGILTRVMTGVDVERVLQGVLPEISPRA
ncbi:MAG: protein kinase [Burkholderiales bacterium]|nr:protein kinase [Burkholderiales bacterium]